MIAGLPAQVAVQPRDAWGNPRGDLGDRLWLQYTPLGLPAVRTAMTAGSDGSFTASYSVTVAGQGALAVAVEYDAPQVPDLGRASPCLPSPAMMHSLRSNLAAHLSCHCILHGTSGVALQLHGNLCSFLERNHDCEHTRQARTQRHEDDVCMSACTFAAAPCTCSWYWQKHWLLA